MNHLTAKFIVLLLCSAITSATFSQKNLLPGYIITTGEDTVRGKIDYRNWEVNPVKILFSTDGINDMKTYTPADIKKFAVADEVYESAVVKTDKSPVNVNQLKHIEALELVEDTVFLQTLITGAKTLYYHKSKTGLEHLFIKQGSEFEWLTYKVFLNAQADETSKIGKNLHFHQQLLNYLGSCPSIQDKVSKLPYKKRPIKNLFEEYYSCVKEQASFQKEADKPGIEAGVLIGASIAKLKFSGMDFKYLIDVDYPSSTGPSGAVFLNFILPRNMKKISIYNELLYTSFKTSGRYSDSLDFERYSWAQTNFQYAYLKINTMFRYKFPANNLFIYVNGGMSNGIAIKSVNEVQKVTRMYTSVNDEKGDAVPRSRKYEPGLILGGGVNYKNIIFDIKYEYSNGMSIFHQLNSPITRLYLMAGYQF